MADEETLHKILQDIANKEDYNGDVNIKPISSGGANYTTNLYLAKISDSAKPDIDIFAKVANTVAARNSFLSKVYLVEALFYSELAIHFQRIYDINNVPAEDRLIIPTYYGHSLIPLKETLVLENLEAKGYQNFDRMNVFDWEYAACAVTNMARYHALGIAFRKDNETEFERVVSNFISDSMNNLELLDKFMNQTVRNVCEALNDDHKRRIENYFSTDVPMKLMKRMMEDNKLLIHGDFRPSNIMHRRVNGNLEMVPLDYQLLRMGTPLADLLLFLYSGSDTEFRKQHYQRYMDHYFTQLSLALRNLNIDVETVYSRETFDKQLIEYRAYGLIISLPVVGLVTVNPEDAPQFDGEVSSMQIKPNQLAKERLSGIVEDFINWGIL